jgi:hypothetical protein
MTSEQAMNGRTAVFARIVRMAPEQQRQIADTYFQGKQPWLCKDVVFA